MTDQSARTALARPSGGGNEKEREKTSTSGGTERMETDSSVSVSFFFPQGLRASEIPSVSSCQLELICFGVSGSSSLDQSGKYLPGLQSNIPSFYQEAAESIPSNFAQCPVSVVILPGQRDRFLVNPPEGSTISEYPCRRSTSQPDGPPDETDENYPTLPTAGRVWEATTAGLSSPSQPATVCAWGPVGRDKEKERRWMDAAALAANACRTDPPRVEQGRIKRAQWWEEERKGHAKAVGRARKEAREWR
eukprot:Cvel_5377.t1-p1 / transcript=Cvel_5377.t1 / gene=Cvel_5377 / organism=Chromera_velia_CCMP2878 / gene_product=hypothetical protein / transcript_product=hypothetical protein / location=Cvel_scaffold250:1-10203(-) / protein_length=248 / sequence_SO=supercontig / SO=protein_coding / is_pseudo=false